MVRRRGWAYPVAKRAFDVVFSLLLLPLLLVVGAVLLLLNPFLNPGPIFFVQPRMGRDCRAFNTVKFRSMRRLTTPRRRAQDPLELDRITLLGAILRKTRLDELPQILNVLRGDMSLIGPRPDCFHHARKFLRVVPGYRERHRVRPGISGLAQVTCGYAQGIDATVAKVDADLHYIRNASFAMDMRVFLRTIVTVLTLRGC
ncbi:MAG: sugar transferase [Rhodobacteraceae bacterium]|nr:MAG: sugar transferase [Paracoccaceae bacterium]